MSKTITDNNEFKKGKLNWLSLSVWLFNMIFCVIS